MRLTRVYVPDITMTDQKISLNAAVSNYLLRVLRLKLNDAFKIFDGKGNEFHAQIIENIKNCAVVKVGDGIINLAESPLRIHLGQAVSRGEKMDYTLQKAVELGVNSITPLFTERTEVKLSSERLANRLEHWRKVMISACEQCGRNYLPTLHTPMALHNWLLMREESVKFILHPDASSQPLKTFSLVGNEVCLLIGPEGGFSIDEVKLAKQAGFQPLRLGPRVLRTETAGPATIAAIQCLWGDMG